MLWTMVGVANFAKEKFKHSPEIYSRLLVLEHYRTARPCSSP